MAAIMNVESPDRRTQNLRDRLNPLEYYSERGFRDFYRFNKHNILLIVADLRPIIARAANHAGLNVVQQLALAGLRFYATGQFQNSTGKPLYAPLIL